MLETSARKAAKIKSIDEIETGKTMFGGKVTLSKEDYCALTDLAKKQLAAENRESELTAEIARLKKENEQLITTNAQLNEQNSQLQNENSRLQSVYGKAAISKIRVERDNLQQRLDKIMEFIKALGLTEKLESFLHSSKKIMQK